MCATDVYLSVLNDVYTELTSKPLPFMAEILSEQLGRPQEDIENYFRSRLDADPSSFLSEQTEVLKSGNNTVEIRLRSLCVKRIWTVEMLSSEIMRYIKKHILPTASPQNLSFPQRSHQRRHRHPHRDLESHRTVDYPTLPSYHHVPGFTTNRPEAPNKVHQLRHQSHSEPHYDRPSPSSHLRNGNIHQSTEDGAPGGRMAESPNITHSRYSHSHPNAADSAPASHKSPRRITQHSGYTADVFRPDWLNIADPGPMNQHDSSGRQHDPFSRSRHLSYYRY